jgi:hypothetical protein
MRQDYINTFKTEEGKRVLADLEKVCLYKTSTFDKEAMVMAFNEGLRSVYLHITTIMNMDIEELEKIAVAQQKGY